MRPGTLRCAAWALVAGVTVAASACGSSVDECGRDLDEPLDFSCYCGGAERPKDCVDGKLVCPRCDVCDVHTCGAGEYCDFPNNSYPSTCTSDGLSRCVERPASCPAASGLVCGCDQQVYASVCHARAAGFDVNEDAKRCEAPAGHFPCGATYCALDSEYCRLDIDPRETACRALGSCVGLADPCQCILMNDTCDSCGQPGGVGPGWIAVCR